MFSSEFAYPTSALSLSYLHHLEGSFQFPLSNYCILTLVRNQPYRIVLFHEDQFFFLPFFFFFSSPPLNRTILILLSGDCCHLDQFPKTRGVAKSGGEGTTTKWFDVTVLEKEGPLPAGRLLLEETERW